MADFTDTHAVIAQLKRENAELSGLALATGVILTQLLQANCKRELNPQAAAGRIMTSAREAIEGFTAATDKLAATLNVRKVGAAAPSEAGQPAGHPIEMQTLVTLDLCHDQNGAQVRNIDFDGATAIHKNLIGQGIRLGQPVKCVKLTDGRWGATVRIGISMPQLVKLSVQNDAEIVATLDLMMDRIAQPLGGLLKSSG